MGPMTWSYQPSESSYMMITAVLVPFRSAFELVDELHQEVLFIERIGIAGVAIFDGARLDEADRGQVVHGQRIPEIDEVIVVVGGVALVADHADSRFVGSRDWGSPSMPQYWKKAMVGNVVGGAEAGDTGRVPLVQLGRSRP